MEFSTTERPRITISSTSVHGTFTGNIKVIAANSIARSRLRAAPSGNVLSLAVTAAFDVVPVIQGNKITASFRNFSPTIEVLSSTIGTVDDGSLTEFVEFAVNHFIIPPLNTIGQEGFPVPTLDGVVFVEPTITTINGAIVLSTDVRYNA